MLVVNIGMRGLSCGQNVTGSTKCSNPANEASSSRSVSQNTNQATHLASENGM